MKDEKFYICNKYSRKFEEQNMEQITIDNHPDFEFAVHLGDDNVTWNVTEAISGSTICVKCLTKDAACEEARNTLNRVDYLEFIEMIKHRVAVYGISPRYLSKVLPC